MAPHNLLLELQFSFFFYFFLNTDKCVESCLHALHINGKRLKGNFVTVSNAVRISGIAFSLLDPIQPHLYRNFQDLYSSFISIICASWIHVEEHPITLRLLH